jgi:hypothetical protein
MPQGHFNVLKGAYPTLQQLDETLPVAGGVTGIVRGSCLRAADDAGTRSWFITAADATNQGAANTPGPLIYFALQDQGQPDVDMAGALSALPCSMPMEVETDQFDAGGAFPIGGYIMAGAAGVVTDHTDDKTAIGQVTRSPYIRWANDAIAVTGKRTGNRVNVISFWAMYIPNLSVA